MSEMTVEMPEGVNEQQLWYTSGGVVYRRGVDGICIHPDGRVTTGLPYGGDVFDIFETSDDFEPLPKGTKITITL